MLTIGVIGGTSGDGRSAGYYTSSVARGRDDYYTGKGEAPGVWFGTGSDAQSSRSFSQVDGGGELPWSLDTLELIDELAAERLPATLLEPGREQREAQAARRREVRENRAWLAEQLPALEALDPKQRAEVAAEAQQRFGDYSTEGWQLRDRVRQLDAAAQHAGAAGDQPAEKAGQA
jgi:hypothetical protein